VWLNILQAVCDSEVDGQSLSEHMESPASLAEFFRKGLDYPSQRRCHHHRLPLHHCRYSSAYTCTIVIAIAIHVHE
jgi:hypothetical protein